MAKYIFFTGGVVSGLGKGITAASLGRLFKARGYKVSVLKFNPYFNMDTSNLSPYQHGEIYVTEDGREGDLVLGHYERILDENLTARNDVTSGEIYSAVISKERENMYGGVAVQVVPHITDEIKQRVTEVGESGADIVIVEVGGTVGDIETQPYMEAIRQLRGDLGKNNVAYVHVSLVPFIEVSGEQKTKPTQHSVKELQNLGIQPDVIVCRSELPLGTSSRNKLSLFCNVDKDCIIENLVSPNIYELPLKLEEEGMCRVISRKLRLEDREPDLDEWRALCDRIRANDGCGKSVKIAIVGRHVEKYDAHLSLREALKISGVNSDVKVDFIETDCATFSEETLKNADGLIITADYMTHNFDGKIAAVKYAIKHDMPVLMIGMGVKAGLMAIKDEFGLTKEPMLDGVYKGRPYFKKGAYQTRLKGGSSLQRIYGAELVSERHHHSQQINAAFIKEADAAGVAVCGTSSSDGSIDGFEMKNKKFFIGVVFCPEFISRPNHAHPLFNAFVESLK